jgi:hypothetical protein
LPSYRESEVAGRARIEQAQGAIARTSDSSLSWLLTLVVADSSLCPGRPAAVDDATSKDRRRSGFGFRDQGLELGQHLISVRDVLPRVLPLSVKWCLLSKRKARFCRPFVMLRD